MARMKRLPSADYFIKRIDRPSKGRANQSDAVATMLRRLAGQQQRKA